MFELRRPPRYFPLTLTLHLLCLAFFRDRCEPLYSLCTVAPVSGLHIGFMSEMRLLGTGRSSRLGPRNRAYEYRRDGVGIPFGYPLYSSTL